MRPFLLLLSRTHSELYNSERMIYTFSSFGFDQNYLLFFSLLHHVKDLFYVKVTESDRFSGAGLLFLAPLPPDISIIYFNQTNLPVVQEA